jgi:ethanolaminephosphotransferase
MKKPPFWNVNQPTVLGYPIIDQIDIVPTLSILFGFPIPKNNLGKIIFNLNGADNGNLNLKKKRMLYAF